MILWHQSRENGLRDLRPLKKGSHRLDDGIRIDPGGVYQFGRRAGAGHAPQRLEGVNGGPSMLRHFDSS
jgi:hypothetical protein